MTRLHHRIIRIYLNRAAKSLDINDLAMARRRFNGLSKSRSKLKIKSVTNTDANGVPVRVYRDYYSGDLRPVIVYFHGGGFVLGSVEAYDSVCRHLAKYTQCAVVSVEYSLAPEVKYPGAINEGGFVLEWLQSKKYKSLQSDTVFLAGDSAGGNIALGVAIQAKTNRSLKGQILIYPAVDSSITTPSTQQYAKKYFLTQSMLRNFWELYQDSARPYSFPSDNQLKGLPPTLIIAAEKDILLDEGRNLADELTAANVPVVRKVYKDMLHGFIQFPKAAGKKVQAFRDIRSFIDAQ